MIQFFYYLFAIEEGEKAVAIKRLEYLPLGSELNKQVSVAGKQYQELNKLFKSSEK